MYCVLWYIYDHFPQRPWAGHTSPQYHSKTIDGLANAPCARPGPACSSDCWIRRQQQLIASSSYGPHSHPFPSPRPPNILPCRFDIEPRWWESSFIHRRAAGPSFGLAAYLSQCTRPKNQKGHSPPARLPTYHCIPSCWWFRVADRRRLRPPSFFFFFSFSHLKNRAVAGCCGRLHALAVDYVFLHHHYNRLVSVI